MANKLRASAISLLFLAPVLAHAAPVPSSIDDAPTGSGATDVWALAAQVKKASGIEQEAGIYDLWTHWDASDPIAIATALKSIADDDAVDPSARVLARSFAAAARLQLGDATGAKILAGKTGTLDRWLVVGPFDHEARAGFGPEIGPELDREGVVTPTTTYEGKGHNGVHWRVLPAEATPYGIVELAKTITPSTAACVFATTFVALPEEVKKPTATPATIHVGASGAVRVYWNGEKVAEDGAERGITFDRFAAPITIAPGWNRVLVKVCGLERSPLLTLRIGDEKGAPMELRVDSDPRHSSPKELTKQKGKKDEAKPAPKKEEPNKEPAKKEPAKKEEAKGKDDAKKEKTPIVLSTPTVIAAPSTPSLFQHLAARALKEDAKGSDLEALARYLHVTDGDDPAHPEARDLARRAAEMEPTVSRWILAGQLAEDRNQERTFVEKAAAIDAKSIEVRYARAVLAASGPDADSAYSLFEDVLAASPDHLNALLYKVRLLETRGLPRTARALVEKALGTRPRTRVLLEAYARLLDVDSTIDGDEVRVRWEELAMTDGRYFANRLGEAIDARDLTKARGVVARWRAVDPTSDVAVREGADALEKLGDPDGAVALYEAGLEVSPEDVRLLLGLANVEGRQGKRDRQLAIYRQVYARWHIPELYEYLENAEKSPPREDEAFAESSDAFLKRRSLPAAGWDERVLSEVSVTTVQPSGLAARFKQIVFQPLTKEAAARAKSYAFAFQADVETVTMRAAKIYRKDGKIDEAATTGVTNNNDPSISTYTSGKIYYVLFPNLDAGDVVEIRYRVEDTTPRNAFGDYFGEVEYLQHLEPSMHEEYVLRVPKGRALSIAQPSINPTFTDETKGDLRTLHWTAQDVPGVIPEAKMPPLTEVLAHVHVSTYEDWPSLATWYWSFIKDQFVADDAMRAKVKELVKGKKNDAEKVAAIYDWVVQETRYVALEFGVHGFLPYRSAQVFARGFGDCKDKAALLVTMLGEAGIDATPVLVRSNFHGDFETKPASLAVFDHMIAYVPSLDLYLDGTAEDHGSNELPAGDRGALALLVDKGKGKIVHLPDAAADKSIRAIEFTAKLEKDSASVDLALSGTGVFAPILRNDYRAANAAVVHEELPSELSAIAWDAPTTNDLEALETTPAVKAKGKGPIGVIEKDRRALPIFTHGSLVADLAPLSTRIQDVRLPARKVYDEKFEYVLPTGGSFDRVPEAKKESTPFGSYAVDVEQTKTGVKVHARFELDVTRVHPAEYPAFRAFLRDADLAFLQRVVVKN